MHYRRRICRSEDATDTGRMRMEEWERRLRELEERGYTIIEDAMPAGSVERLRDELERLYARQAEITGKPWGP